MNEAKDSQTTRAWDTYWKGAREAEAYSSGGVSHPLVASFWDDTLGESLGARDHTRVLDIATGSGAVVERLTQLSGDSQFDITCVDISGAAIGGVLSRFPEVGGVVADASSVPLDSSAYDLITSQFGIEYAGPSAFDEAARLLAPGGSLILLMHIAESVIYHECSAALDAVRRTQKSGFVALALHFFEAGFAAVRGADRAAYDRAALQLNPAIQELESILSDHGQQVAGDTVARLYADVQKIHSRLQYYEPDEVLGWLRTMETELSEYEERMASMCNAAIDDSAFQALCEKLRGLGLSITKSEALLPGDDPRPLAWVLQADRGADPC